MKYKYIKIMTHIIVYSILLNSCKMTIKSFFDKDKTISPKEDFTISSTTPNIHLTYDEILETIMENIESTVSETIEPTEELIAETETTTNETEIPNITEQTPSNIIIKENQVVTPTTNINVHSSNTTDSMIIGNLNIYDTAINIISYDNKWSLIKTNEFIGFVYKDYLEPTEEIVKLEYEHTQYKDIILTTTDLNFRTAPTTETEIIRTFKINTELEVIAKTNNGWLLVKYNGTIGYVKESYTISLLDKAKEKYPEINLTELDINKIVYITASELNIRKGPGTDYERNGILEKYESVRVLKEFDEWYFIMTNEYTFGFINKNYTESLEDIFVIVDLSEQRLYMYNNNELYLVAPVTTGKDSTPSDKGLFKIWYKGTNEEIVPGYIVDYWMPYNSACEGLHDAERWRNQYGMYTEAEKQAKAYRYNGSNGCINMQKENAKIIFETVSIGTKVLTHK